MEQFLHPLARLTINCLVLGTDAQVQTLGGLLLFWTLLVARAPSPKSQFKQLVEGVGRLEVARN